MATLKEALDVISKLSTEDKETLQSILTKDLSPTKSMEEFLTDERFANGRVCPKCGCIHIVRNGHRKDGKQRYRCKDCGVTFVITNNSITSHTRKSLDVWETYINCMMNCFSIRKTAEICKITTKTAFIWRHKILDALQNMADGVVLEGIVEADETFFPISYKGNHKRSKKGFILPREVHKRGKSVHKRGISNEQVCVPCAINRNGLSISKVGTLGKVKKECLHLIYDNKIKSGTTVCTDKEKAYRKFSCENDLNLIQLDNGKTVKGLYNIQHINSYHSQLKKFIDHFNGVSTKHLNNYLIWNNFVNYAVEKFSEKQQILTKYVLTTIKSEVGEAIFDRPAVPVLV